MRILICRSRRYICALQYKTFWLQNFWSTIIFVPTLIAIFVLINFFREWNYSSNVILDNTDFNLVLFITIFMGIFSFLLSFKITWIKSIKFILRCISRLDDSRIEDHYNKCSFSINENHTEKKSNVSSLRHLAIQKRNSKLITID